MSSWNTRRSFSAALCSSASAGGWLTSANRIESSNTASWEREKVSHFFERLSSTEHKLTVVPHFLTEENVVFFPVSADTEALAKASILVCFGKDPWGGHERATFSRGVRASEHNLNTIYLEYISRSLCSIALHLLHHLAQQSERSKR